MEVKRKDHSERPWRERWSHLGRAVTWYRDKEPQLTPRFQWWNHSVVGWFNGGMIQWWRRWLGDCKGEGVVFIWSLGNEVLGVLNLGVLLDSRMSRATETGQGPFLSDQFLGIPEIITWQNYYRLRAPLSLSCQSYFEYYSVRRKRVWNANQSFAAF